MTTYAITQVIWYDVDFSDVSIDPEEEDVERFTDLPKNVRT